MTTSTQSSCEPQLLIPFKVTRSAFASGLLNLLEENDFTPVDIFEQISFAKALKIFVPMYKFEGTYSGTWKCSVERSAQSIRRDPQNRYKIKNGKTSGKFSVLCRACSGDDLPEALLEFTRVRKYPGARTFSQEELEQGRNRRARILAALTALFMPGLWLPLSVAAVGELFFFYIWSRYFAYSFDNYDAESPYAQQNRALREASAASVLDNIRRAEKRLGKTAFAPLTETAL